jgi:3-deoxy-manno-octulosonate cytidylyltransferase (CMP-KDO synthetase)
MSEDELENPARVKIALGSEGAVGDFRRTPFAGEAARLHVGVYAFRAEILESLVALRPSPRELAERLEQLRWLEAGYSIGAAEVSAPGPAVDTAEDLARVREILAGSAESRGG